MFLVHLLAWLCVLSIDSTFCSQSESRLVVESPHSSGLILQSEVIGEPLGNPSGRSERPSLDLQSSRDYNERITRDLDIYIRKLDLSLHESNTSDLDQFPQCPACNAFGVCKLEDFEIKKELGRGGFGTVHLAVHGNTGQSVAIKTIKKKYLKENQLELANEERFLMRFNHPNIVGYYCTIVDNESSVHMVMELVKGFSIKEMMDTADFHFSMSEVASIIAQTILVLKHLNQKGIVHRDIKPHNIMIELINWRVKLIDFGLSTSGESDPSDEFVGSPAFASPEALLGEPCTGASDLYSLGLVAFYMYTDGQQVERRKKKDSLYDIIKRRKDSGWSIPKTKSKRVNELIATLTIFDPNDRIKSVYGNWEKFKALAIFRKFQWPSEL